MNARDIRSIIFEVGCWIAILMVLYWMLFE